MLGRRQELEDRPADDGSLRDTPRNTADGANGTVGVQREDPVRQTAGGVHKLRRRESNRVPVRAVVRVEGKHRKGARSQAKAEA